MCPVRHGRLAGLKGEGPHAGVPATLVRLDGLARQVPDADTGALLDRGGQTLQASLTSLQSALAGPGGYTYIRTQPFATGSILTVDGGTALA